MLTVSKKMSMEVEDNGAKEISHFHCTKPHFFIFSVAKTIFPEAATKRLFQNLTTHGSKNCEKILYTIDIHVACQTLPEISHHLYRFMSF
jgi:hypothetical protein